VKKETENENGGVEAEISLIIIDWNVAVESLQVAMMTGLVLHISRVIQVIYIYIYIYIYYNVPKFDKFAQEVSS
jgi:hypothetical protein